MKELTQGIFAIKRNELIMIKLIKGGKVMNIDSRMDEFEKVQHKSKNQDIEGRMEEFKSVDKMQKEDFKDRSTSTLPHGVKRYRTCRECGDTMEIEELKDTEALYYCKTCKKKVGIKTK